ncbi:uncharacterized protein BXZ73DRAFT_10848, partial [Epithele typhae]|uniref:uncharacterized protein n=1 Tax=Epithele typhae TaxID=378194 RepID=UPI002007C21D
LRQISFAIINSPTKLLPAWNEILRDLQLPPRMLPRDVRTRWHSTGDMIHLSLKYRAAVDRLTSDKTNDLRHLEIDPTEWTMA